VRHDRACSGNVPVSVSGVCIVCLEAVCHRYYQLPQPSDRMFQLANYSLDFD
jgi:hypothetical protein